jgi:nucleoside-diphosphate-sugar epimerase
MLPIVRVNHFPEQMPPASPTCTLVTGANGFIGQHLCRSLLDNGLTVRGLRHSDQPLYFVREDEVEWRSGDLTRPKPLAGICDGIDTVYHLAALPRNDLSKSWDDFLAVNVRGTEALLAEAQRAGVRRLVFVSTVEAAGYGDGIHPRREDDEPHPDNNYGKSKLLAERAVLTGGWSLERTVVRLPMVYGPGTFLIVPKLFGMVRRGWYPLIGSGNTLMEFCYVANAVRALRLAAEKPEASGQLFYVSDERSYCIREVVSEIAKAMGVKVRFMRVPVWLAMVIAIKFEVLAKLLPFPPIVSRYSRKPFFTRETVRWTTGNVNVVSIERIRRMLGYRPATGIAQGCAETARWLREQGAV